MTKNALGLKMGRRPFLQTAGAFAAGSGFSLSSTSQRRAAQPDTVRDRLWVFCNPVNADFQYVRKRSVMSPLESAVYLGAPNIIMVNQYSNGEDGCYRPWEPPFEQYAFPLKVEKRVVWSIVGAAGVTKESERKQVIEMAQRAPNFAGVYMDDFFEGKGKVASLTVEELEAIQQKLKGGSKPLDLYVTLYTHDLDRPIREYLKRIDVITLWTWETAELANLDANLAKLERLAPKSRILLGCFTADYDAKRTPMWVPLPVPSMKRQCEFALRCLRRDRIKGCIIYGNFFDLGWESVEWTRQWIERVGEARL